MLSAGVGVQKRRKTEIQNHRISFKFPEITRAIRSDRSCKGNIPSGKAKVKSRHNQNRSFRWTRGSQETSSAIRGSGVHMSKFLDIENPEIAICDFAI
jgi:hypothetical protein